MVDLIIENAAFIITMDANHRIIEDGALAIDEGKILSVGKTEQIKKEYPTADKRLDGKGKVITPGFVDAHIHCHHALARGLMDDIPYYPDALERVHGIIYPPLDENAYFVGGLLNMIEMISTGTTCFVDCGVVPSAGLELENSLANAVKKTGIRAVLGRGMFDIYEGSGYEKLRPEGSARFSRETTEQALRHTEDFVSHMDGAENGRIRAWPCVTQVNTASDELWIGANRIAEKYNVGLLTHAAVIETMVDLTRNLFHKREIERIHDLGVLGPRVVAAHMGWLTPEELQLVIRSGMHVVHCISSSMHCGYSSCGRGYFPEMYASGVNVALGCDGVVESNHLDMVRQTYLAATVHKEVRYEIGSSMPFRPEQALEMATINGAKAVMMPQSIGSLENNKKADIVIFNAQRPEWTPLHRANLISNLVYSATGSSVETSIIDGKVVMENRKILTVDESEVIKDAQKASEKFFERYEKTPR